MLVFGETNLNKYSNDDPRGLIICEFFGQWQDTVGK